VEIPAARSLLMSPWFSDLGRMGFIPGVNMVTFDKYDLVEKVEYYLRNNDERERIAQAGHKLILENHTDEIRAQQLLRILHEVSEEL
jgi:spore maturation protein CgeB